ncbi:MAG: hypothetical protein ACFFAS_10555 [Promethearchaeota archaeon]
MSKKRKSSKGKKKTKDNNAKEYGVVLLKNKKYKHRIYPQKGKVPKDDDENYKIV